MTKTHSWLSSFLFVCASALFAAFAPKAAWADVFIRTTLQNDQISALFFGLLIGVVLSAAAYLFFIWLVMHDRGQVFLIAFLLCLCVNIYSSNDLLMNKIGLLDANSRYFLVNFSLIASWIFALLFTFSFLELDINNPGFKIPFLLLGALLVFILFYSLIDRTLIYLAFPLIGTFVLGAILLAGVSGVYNRTSGSLIHIVAFTSLLGGILAEPAYVLGLLKTQTQVNGTTCLSFALSSLIFAIVIASQFAARQEEKEKALAISNERFSLATRGANEGLFDWNLVSGEVFFSDQFRRILGFRLINGPKGLRQWIKLVQPPYRRALMETVRRFRRSATAITLTVEYCIERPNGEKRWLHSKAVAVRDRLTHGVLRMVGSTSDITERKKSEFALLASEARFRSIIEAHPVPVLIVAIRTGAILYAAPGSEQLLGMKRKEIETHRLEHFMPNTSVRGKIAQDIASHVPVDSVEASIVCGNGEEIPAAVSARGLTYRDHEAMVMGLSDLTERKKAEVQIAQQQEALQQSEKMAALGGLLAGVAHELNNPLSVVVGQSTLLMEGATETKVASRAEKIFKAADRCSRIVKSFLALARRKPPEHKLVDLNQIVSAALELLGYQFKTEDVELHTSLDPSLREIIGDSDQLTQVVTNLVLNATQAMDSWSGPKRIAVSTKREDDTFIVLTIEDTGPGIPADIRSRIFEPFFTTKSNKGGTGVGLALCMNIVSAHGGDIFLTETEGGGATFTIKFPFLEKPLQEDDVALNAASEVVRNLKILLVDDEIELVQTLADLLEPEGHTVDIAINGAIAMEKLRAKSFDVIISDLRMPVMDGPALYAALERELPSYTNKIIYVTGDTLSSHVQDFLKNHVVPIVEKPYRLKDIRRALGELLRKGVTSL
ncbi:MAG: ATP-binding protein [Alphaproteobacteria bacterium]|nr:ATP-binding protein [Alphaproteobacteria bacterium]